MVTTHSFGMLLAAMYAAQKHWRFREQFVAYRIDQLGKVDAFEGEALRSHLMLFGDPRWGYDGNLLLDLVLNETD